MPTDTDIFESLRQELRRGTLILAVLAQLREERYGYSLRQALAVLGVEIDEGALYPMLREEDKRKKRFYQLSEEGRAVLVRLAGEWRAINAALEPLL
jgi:PadR family transcriptional regulator, regulatory protein PadR